MNLLRTLTRGILCVTTAMLAGGSPALTQIVPPPAAPPAAIPPHPAPNAVPHFTGEGSGTLQVLTKDGKQLVCPLKHTDVQANISGYVARVTVRQQFSNPFKEKIEAVYTFPLSDTGAVDEMWMKTGERTIHGQIKRKEEARKIYETAKQQGHIAALLDQERPNIFTQSVTNIEPGKDVEVTLSYVDLLPYEAGNYTFAFPTVVGPRFNPGLPVGHVGEAFSADTTVVADASKITPHVAPEGVRSGHDIAISVSINAGVPVGDVSSKSHEVKITRTHSPGLVIVSLKDKETIPNKDFVLTWAVSTNELHSGYLTNGKDGSGYFALMVLPPKQVKPEQVQPKEMIFLIDCSGSQRGAPLQKAKEAMLYCLDHMNAQDTFQVIAFNNVVTMLFEKPRVASAEMRQKARDFVNSLDAHGGTWMAPAVEAACKQPTDDHRLRIVSFMTDGLVGNDMQIIGMIKKLRNTSRWFPFGTGNSINRFLIDNIAKEGGGEPEYVYLNSSAAEVGSKFYAKIASPVLTDVKADFDGLQVKEVFPHELADVWSQKPLYIVGRYTSPGKGTVTISGYSGGKPYTQRLPVELPKNEDDNAVLGSLWARAKVDRLMSEDWIGAQSGSINKELRDEIVKVALDHHIMTQYTSFVAVEEQTVTKEGKPTTVEVPVEMPEGVSREGVFGDEQTRFGMQTAVPRGFSLHTMNAPAAPPMSGARFSMAPSFVTSTGGLPPVNMGKTVHQAGDNQYSRHEHYGQGFAGGALSPPSMDTAGGLVGAVKLKPVIGSGGGAGAAPAFDSRVQAQPSAKMDKSEWIEVGKPKLAAILQRLAQAKLKPDTTSWEGLKIRNGAIVVRLKVKDTSDTRAMWRLAAAGLVAERVIAADGVVVGRVTVSRLFELAADEAVISVEPAADEGT